VSILYTVLCHGPILSSLFPCVFYCILRFPIHAAVVGGNLNLVQWLATDHCCPLRECTSGRKVKKAAAATTTDGPILTSKGRSALEIALTDRQMEIVRYLVAEKRMLFSEEKYLQAVPTLVDFTTTLVHMLPKDFFDGREILTNQQLLERKSCDGPTISVRDSDSPPETGDEPLLAPLLLNEPPEDLAGMAHMMQRNESLTSVLSPLTEAATDERRASF
jgi:hypothetical protein